MVERMAEKRPLPLRGVFADNFIVLEALAPAPKTELRTLAGEPTTLETYQGRVVLLNFWATWCAPCIREMPSLDRLQAALGPEGLQVVAVSVDRGGADIVEPFLRELGIARLEILLDQKFKSARAFAFSGLPTTYVIDVEGRLIGGLEGPAEWDGPEALELLRYYLPKAELQRVGTGSSLE
jgi:thiol-disulfide isomerase/thioredoxin